MSDNESNAGRSRVPAASFSRLSATRVVLGLDKAQLIVCVIGLAILVAGAAMGLNVPIMILGALVLAYGIPRIQGLSLVSWTWIWTHWRGRLKDGTNRWAYSPLASGRPLGVLGLYGHVEDRAQTIEGDVGPIAGCRINPHSGDVADCNVQHRRLAGVIRLLDVIALPHASEDQTYDHQEHRKHIQ